MPREARMPPRVDSVLLVDDNDRYAEVIRAHLERRGAMVERARSAREGLLVLEKRAGSFQCLITDITMETQLSGLRILRKARGLGFSGMKVTTSTGLDTRIGYLVNRFVLGILYGCDYLIPKKPIKRRGKVAWIRV
ncbi:response regulator [Candidatus Fermentibacteria bacterium]|nr:response regulator [Candidatus Fermentibacteria bacterium]